MRIWTKSLTGNPSTFLTTSFRGGFKPPLTFQSTKSETNPMKPDFIFEVPPSKLRIFHFLLQQGLRLETPVGGSVQDFLVRQLGLNPEVIDEKIQTIFLNGKAVDDPGQAFLTDGASLALSGALPGLVGATMRRGGFYASLRNPITFQGGSGFQESKNGTIVVKLFNILLKDLGPRILENGFMIEESKLLDFLRGNESKLADECQIRDGDGIEIPYRNLLVAPSDEPGKYLFVKVGTR